MMIIDSIISSMYLCMYVCMDGWRGRLDESNHGRGSAQCWVDENDYIAMDLLWMGEWMDGWMG